MLLSRAAIQLEVGASNELTQQYAMILSRAAIQLAVGPNNVTTPPKISVPQKTSGCTSIPVFKSVGHDDTSCHIIDRCDVWV